MTAETLVTYRNPSPLEKVFGFENKDFRQYMKITTIGNVASDSLLDLQARMSQDRHPVVMLGTGWLLAEMCMRDDPQFTQTWRKEALSKTQELWNDAEQLRRRFATAHRFSGARLQDVFALRLEIRNSQTYLPAIHGISTRIHSGEAPQQLLAKTRGNLLSPNPEKGFGAWLIKTAKQAAMRRRQREMATAGEIGEVLTGGVLYRTRSKKQITVAASLRQNHHKDYDHRADLIVHDFSTEEHIRCPLQVKTREIATGKHIIPVRASPELCFQGCRNPYETLGFLVDEYARKPIAEERQVAVNSMAANLLEVMRAYIERPASERPTS